MKRITKQVKQDIELLIADIEKKTTGEIVPVVLADSDSYPAAHFRWAIFLSLIFTVGLYFAPIELPDPIWFLAAQALGITLGLIIAFFPKAKRFMLTKGEMNIEVHQRALQAFYEHGVGNTSDRDGVLVFISLLEHRAEILADIGIAQKVPQADWQHILSSSLLKLKSGDLPGAITSAIYEIGDKLTQAFPRLASEEKTSNQESQLDDSLRTQ